MRGVTNRRCVVTNRRCAEEMVGYWIRDSASILAVMFHCRFRILVSVATLVVTAHGGRLQAQASTRAPVHDSAWIATRGTRLYLDIRGPANPAAVLLFLHGGPGQGLNGLLTVEAYPGPLIERHYAVAYLHQRGVLRSPAVPPGTQTLANHVDDVDHVVAFLHRRYPRAALAIAGHSWGGLLAVAYAERHPEAPVAGLVLVAAPVSFVHNERASYDTALAWAKRTRNDTALRDLARVGPPPHAAYPEIAAYRQWTARAVPGTSFEPDMAKVLAAGGYTAPDSSWFATQMQIALAMIPSLVTTDLRAGLSHLRMPLLAIAGGHDGIVLAAPMFEDLATYGGPKRFVTFTASDHFLFMEEPERFARELSRFLASLSGSERLAPRAPAPRP